MPRHTHYTALDLNKKATQAEIKKAWRKIAFESHPDRAETRGLAKRAENSLQRRFQKARAAWEVLSDPQTRQDYDTELVAQRRRPRPRTPTKTRQEPSPEEVAEREYRRFLRRQAQAEARIKRRHENMRRARDLRRAQEREWAAMEAEQSAAADELYLQQMVVKLRCKIAHFLLRGWDSDAS